MATEKEEVAIGFHAGEALWAFASTYPTLPLCLVEAVQNGIDANAKVIFVGVDLLEHRVAVCDDGDGVSKEQFAEALLSVGMGIKSEEKIGRFGRGLISPLPLARTMQFLSRVRWTSDLNSWLLIGERLRRMRSNLTADRTSLEEFPSLPAPFTHIHNEAKVGRRASVWNTMVLLDQVTEDNTLSFVDPVDFELTLLGKLRRPMREKGVTVFLKVRDKQGRIKTRKITASSFTGQPLDEVVMSTKTVGTVIFRLYKARLTAGKRQGMVEIFQTGDLSSVSARDFRTQAMGLGWYGSSSDESIKKGIDALCSGFFEGGISADGIELHPERKKFMGGDALTDVYALIGDWYDKHGAALLNDENERRAEKRYQELGAMSLQRLMDRFDQNPAFAELNHALRGVLPAADSSSRTRSERSEKREKTGGSRRVVVRPKREPSEHPRQRRGGFLNFAYELLKGSARLWEYDHESGTLTFNIRHNLWGRVDKTGKQSAKTDKQIMHLQEWLAFKLLLLLASGIKPEDIDLHRQVIDNELEPYIEGFVLS